jgi:hypothetical protein
MANAAGLLIVLIGGLIGLGLVLGTFALLVYGLVTKTPARGLVASIVALVLSVLASLLSTPFWIVVLSGRDTHHERLDYAESWPLVALVVVEALALGSALFSIVRNARRHSSARP